VFTHLFSKVPQSGDREVSFSVFESSSHALVTFLTSLASYQVTSQRHNKRTCRLVLYFIS